MAAIQPEYIYTAHPDVVSAAIKFLASAVVAMSGALMSVLLYIWHNHRKELRQAVSGLESQIGKLSDSLDSIAQKLFGKTDNLEHRLSRLEGEHNGWKDHHERRQEERRMPQD